MKLHNPTAEIFVPDGKPVAAALARTTHLGIAAHQDDLEIMAFLGILAGYHSGNQWLVGVTCTDGAGSSRTGPYAGYTDAQMRVVGRHEQNAAAVVGEYGVMIQLDYPSRAVKSTTETALRDDLKQI